MSKLILLVDDSPDDRAVFSSYLEFVGGSVVLGSDGEEGFRLATEEAPDLILLGLELPGTDGWGLMQRLQLDPRTSEIPVVALGSESVDQERLESAGFCGSLSKPVSPFRLLEEVERCLGALAAPRETPPPLTG